ncbi:MAG TPA: pantoate--beta-alanine ligase, partial [Nocardioidaceae bacterium]|nr:pantoate--beta-alanine ligase [Nocardioidaceae bacterium]
MTRTRAELDDALKDVRAADGRIALVPTMGALHEGHASLLRTGRAHGETLVASVFVNPTQFGPGEDFDRYPRTFDADLEVCARAGVDVVFAPVVEDVYPGGDVTVTVDPGPLADELEGAVRPGHFRGVLTVVAKMLGLVRPHAAVLGQKDYQQLVLIRQMVLDLCMNVAVVGGETVREADGLALSSRNAYLSADDRATALALSRALRAGVDAAGRGHDAVLAAAHGVLDHAGGLDLDYLALRAPDLGPAPTDGPARILVAGRVGTTRLLDNMPLTLGPAE